MIVHKLRLNDPWFEYTKSGQKRYEGRRATDKINLIQPDDTIEFISVNRPNDRFRVKVLKVLSFPTFRDALSNLPINEVLPNVKLRSPVERAGFAGSNGSLRDLKSIDEGVEIYYRYVSLPTQLKDGVKMIYIEKEVGSN